jgi:hypothetical protein
MPQMITDKMSVEKEINLGYIKKKQIEQQKYIQLSDEIKQARKERQQT